MPNIPAISIIIVSYNHFETSTGPCLQSLIRDPVDMEIIVVDNASDSYTRSELKKIAQTDSRIRLHCNTTNRGYAGANNDGVSLAASDLIILLNNDTLVPAGAVGKFINLFHTNENWHMLGPMTNENGNEQRMYSDSDDVATLLKEGESWCQHSGDFSFTSDELGFFCVAMQKSVYEQLSGLDESFGLGFYEDTDFCVRACKAGLNLFITESIFIYHQGSATFSKLPDETRKLLKVNRKRFLEKHGKKFLRSHARDKNLQVLEQYRRQCQHSDKTKETLYKAHNRLLMAEQLQPNSPIKKFTYNKRLKRLQHFFKTMPS